MFSDLERKIGLALYYGEKTPEELAEELNEDIRDVIDALKKLIKLKIVVKEGYPPKYRLADNIREAVKPKDFEPVEGIKIYAVVEVQAIDEALAKKALEKIIRQIKKEPGVHVLSAEISKIEQDKESGMYSGYVELKLNFEAFEPLMHFMFFYGPSVVEVIGPEKIVLDMGDLHRGLLEAATMINGYVHYITRMMTKKELEEFNKRLVKDLFK
ncbi:MAG: hypothetical protein PWP76_759 [Candidatus Diapherotrites archaeon]|nr:hypothetical protein [Candidatus Diapherotrites archaeon]MDN5367179.1 hypothetical protein [Candidatus Diapherotrites archaeon]